MKKIILIVCFTFIYNQNSSAQAAFGLKGGVNYNAQSIKEAGTDIFSGAKSKTGYHAGIWLRIKVPILGIYIRPEFVYTNLENEITYNYKTNPETTDYSFQKLDIPVLFGKNIFGVGNVFIGPSFQYILDSNFSIQDISNANAKGFTVGLQFGGGLEIGNIGIDVRWERGFNGVESTILAGTTNVTFDTRVNQIIFGLSYKL
jgi:hypothetical protein